MPTRFGRFELDEVGRALRLDGREQALQPLVFDLLVYLVTHRERVVPKEELLSKLWAGTIVTEGSLQRAVSLLRSALRDGGSPNAVQTHARRGYRFCDDSAGFVPSAEEGKGIRPERMPGRSPSAAEGRALLAAGDFGRALAVFEAASPDAEPSAEDLEAWAEAAMCAGRPEQSVGPLERAVAAFEARREMERAARAALLLTNVKLELREFPIAKGWLARAQSHLADRPEGKQHGMAEWLAGRFALFEGRLEDCASHAEAAMGVARRVSDPDLHCLALVYSGHVSIAQGRVRHGLSLHDEAGAAALAGRPSVWASGVVFCSVIWVYLHLGDHHRAGQWANEFARWCERHPAYAFPALCRLHRGEVLAARGELSAAQQEIERARGQLAISGPYTEGDAHRVLGEIYLLRGDLDAAETALREAYRLGWNPQPALAQLFAARGQEDAAMKQLEAALAHPGWTDGQRKRTILAVLARIAAARGKLERARSALRELDALEAASITNASSAEVARARAEVLLAEGDARAAESWLRAAISAWLEAGARVHAAHVRLRLCEVLLETGDRMGAELELTAAESVFREVQAEPLLKTCCALRARTV